MLTLISFNKDNSATFLVNQKYNEAFRDVYFWVVCFTAVFSVVTQRSSSGEERCVTTLKTAV